MIEKEYELSYSLKADHFTLKLVSKLESVGLDPDADGKNFTEILSV
jgi:hypothetical protein